MIHKCSGVFFCLTWLLTMSLVVGPVLTVHAAPDLSTRKDTPQQFYAFIENCSLEERIEIAVAGRLLPRLRKSDFGKYGLKEYADYDKDKRPRTFNELSVENIVSAFEEERLPRSIVSAGKIQGRILWLSSHWIPWIFRRVDNTDYHGIVLWVARQNDVSAENIEAISTFELERMIVENYLIQLWDDIEKFARRQVEEDVTEDIKAGRRTERPDEAKMNEMTEARTQELRVELLTKIEQETGMRIENKVAIAAMGGAGAIGALSAIVTMSGFAFYTTMSVIIATVAGWVGLTLPFVVYMTASSIVALLSGPVGWAIGTFLAATAAVLLGRPNSESTRTMIMTIHIIKANQIFADQ